MRKHLLAAAVLVAVVPWTPAPALAGGAIDGYVWGWQPATANYFANNGYEHNSAGGAVQITRSGVGRYLVRFHNMADTGGVAHVSAYGSPNLCAVTSWGPSGADELVYIRCYNMAGAAVDTRFVANITNHQTADHFGYLWSDDPTPPAGHVPPALYSFDSAGLPITVDRSAVGSYQVSLGAFALDPAWADGVLRVTPYGAAARHCQILDPAVVPDASILEVRCFDDTGFGVDTRFTLSYARDVHLLGYAAAGASATADLSGMVPGLRGWSNTAGGAPAVTSIVEGTYRLSFPNAAVPRGHAIATIMGTAPMFCTVSSWYPSGTSLIVNVHCYDGGNGDPNPAIGLNVAFIS